MMAAIQAGLRGKKVLLLEKNNCLGKKLLITGNGRCNITNSAPVGEMVRQIPGNGRFLYSALYTFDNTAVIYFFNRHGVKTKVERGGRIFPQSDRSREVVECLARLLKETGVKTLPGHSVWEVVPRGDGFAVRTVKGTFTGEKVVIAAGGASCPRTGSSGDAYTWAKAVGHTVTPILPALVPLVTREKWVTSLQGLSLKNVGLTAWQNGKLLGREFGEMLFTHYGVSGPMVLTLSRAVAQGLHDSNGRVTLELNLKPALSEKQLDRRLLRDFEIYSRRQFKNSLEDLLPKLIIPVIIELSGIDPGKWAHQVTREERKRLAGLFRSLTMTVTGTRPLAEAIVTSGGVSVKEIDPSTMESKIVPGLYFAGEVMDVDGYTGGFNLQIAWSTGYVAGMNI